jgi:integrase/recombinase XerD
MARGEVRPLTRKEAKKLFSVCLKCFQAKGAARKLNKLHQFRARAEVGIALLSGLRVAEISELKFQDFLQDDRLDHEDTHYIHVRNGKGGKSRYVQVGKSSIELLEGYKTFIRDHGYSHNPDDYLFFSFRGSGQKKLTTRRIQQDCESVLEAEKIVGHSIHDLRHTYATSLFVLGKDLYMVQKQLGHEDQATTLRYVSLAGKFLGKLLNALYK